MLRTPGKSAGTPDPGSEGLAPYALSPGESAKYIGVSRQTIYNMMSDGRLPSVKIGKSRRIRVDDLHALFEGAA